MEENFSKIYEQYYCAIKRYIFNKLKDEEVSEDITQDVFMKVFIAMKKGNYKENGYMRAYIYTLAHNETDNYLGSMHYKKSVTTYKQDPKSWNQIPCHRDILEEFCLKETINQVLEILGRLPDFYLESFLLVRFDDKQYKEAAKILGIPLGTVKSQINSCKSALIESGFKFYQTKGKKMIAVSV